MAKSVKQFRDSKELRSFSERWGAGGYRTPPSARSNRVLGVSRPPNAVNSSDVLLSSEEPRGFQWIRQLGQLLSPTLGLCLDASRPFPIPHTALSPAPMTQEAKSLHSNPVSSNQRPKEASKS